MMIAVDLSNLRIEYRTDFYCTTLQDLALYNVWCAQVHNDIDYFIS